MTADFANRSQSPNKSERIAPTLHARLGVEVPAALGASCCVKFCHVAFIFFVLIAGIASGQSNPAQVKAVLSEEILPPKVAEFQMREYLLNRVASPPVATTVQQWNAEAQRLRRHLLEDVVFHGWPKEWVNALPRFEDLGAIETGHGYRLRKLRYEVVPGFQSVAVLYEPEKLLGKVPAILNVNGHVGPLGKAVEYKQKRCINFAKHGILALNVEWLAYGELAEGENQHWFGAHLDLVGANALGVFFLEMRRALDYLYNHPHVDRNRLGMTGLSGGGWQTIVLSALDERVKVAVPVAGYSSLRSEVEARQYGDLGDVEQNGTDFLAGVDYTHLTAMLAPRATLLIYNAEDDCCYRGPLVKPLIFDDIKPFFRLYGKENLFQWYENRDPGSHNYQLYNRERAYQFFGRQFDVPSFESEIPVGQEIQTYEDLVVGLPKNNLTILGLARKLGDNLTRPLVPVEESAKAAWVAAQRKKLGAVVRYKPATLSRVWAVANTENKGLETKSYLFEMTNGLSVDGVCMKGIATAAKTPMTIVLNDHGKKTAGVEVSEAVNRGEQVLALDLMLMGDTWKDNEQYSYAQIIDAVGERPLGMEAAQLIEIAHWVLNVAGVPKVAVECTGIRSQGIALVAAALEPDLFSRVTVREGMRSLQFLLQAPVTFNQAPDLFCLDLYKEFDMDRLAAIAAPTLVTIEKYVEIPKKSQGVQ